MIVLTIIHYHSLSCLRSNGPSRNVLASLPRIFFDTEVIPSLTLNFEAVLFKLHPDCGSHRKKIFHKHCWASFSSIRLHIKLPLHFSLPVFLEFFRFSHFPTFSVTVVRIFVQFIALLFFTGRWQCGSHCIEPALATPADRKTVVHYHPLGQTDKTIMNAFRI